MNQQQTVSFLEKNEEINGSDSAIRPIRFQLDEPNLSLKETFNIQIKANNVIPLETQIAGHGSENDGHSARGLLMHEAGFVLKPVQVPPKGEREIAFYRHISTSDHPIDKELVQLTAKFYGTESVKIENGVVGHSNYLVLENLTKDLKAPCVMDIKIGSRTYGPDASDAKKAQEDAKYQGTKGPFGFSVLGVISHSKTGVKRLGKSFARSLNEDNIDEVLQTFINLDPKMARLVAEAFLHKLAAFNAFFGKQTRYHIFASSLLFVYDYDIFKGDNLDKDVANFVQLRLIDFAHVFPGHGQLDQNFIFGLENLSKLFQKFIDAL